MRPFLSARWKIRTKFGAIQLEGGTEETLGVDYGKTFIAAVPKGTALSQIKISFTPADDVKTEDGKVKAPVKAGADGWNIEF